MFGRTLTSLVEGVNVENAKEDKKKAVTAGQYKISSQAIYKADDTYLPLGAVTEVVQDKGCTHVTGCCAGSVPVDRLVIRAGEQPFIFQFASEKSAAKAKEMIEKGIKKP